MTSRRDLEDYAYRARMFWCSLPEGHPESDRAREAMLLADAALRGRDADRRDKPPTKSVKQSFDLAGQMLVSISIQADVFRVFFYG